MRRAVVTADRQVRLLEVEAPVPGPGEALVRMTLTGLCGSDRHAIAGRHPFITLPYAPGHEVLGVIEQASEDGTTHATRHAPQPDATPELRPGQRVVVEPTLPCWDCKQCGSGRENLCERLRFFGCGHDQGGLSDLFTIPLERLHPIPGDLDDRRAILVEPLSTPVHAVRLAGPVDGKAVAVLGGGPIGLLTLLLARRDGAARVVLTDRHESKLAQALELGAHASIDARAPDVARSVRTALGESADVVFDCVATQASLDQAIELAGKGGIVVVVGVASRAVTLPLPQVQDQQIRVQGSATYLPEDFRRSIELLGQGFVDPEAFITAAYPLSDAAAAFAALATGEHLKVVVAGEPP